MDLAALIRQPRTQRAAMALFAATLVGVLTGGGFFPVARVLLVGVLPGVLAALIAASMLDAALIAPIAVAAAAVIAPLYPTRAPGDALEVVGGIVLAAVIALAIALACRFALARKLPRAGTIIVVVALLFVVACMWGNTLYITTATGSPTLAQTFDTHIPGGATLGDAGIYLYYYQHLRAGESYYVINDQLIKPTPVGGSAFSYRPPTLYWLLATLAPNGTGIVVLGLVFASIAVVSAFVLSAQLVRWPLALVSATAIAVFYEGVLIAASILNAEPWAMALGLAAVALFAIAIRREAHTVRFMWAAAAVAALAVLFRELLAYVLLAGLVATLVSAELRSRRLWIPWVAGIAAALAVLATHWHATGASLLTRGGGAAYSWFIDPGWSKFWGAVHWDQGMPGAATWIVFVTLGLGWIAAGTSKPLALRVFLVAVAIVPAAGLALAGPGTIGNFAHAATGYWGDAAVPMAVALCGAGLGFASFARQADRPAPEGTGRKKSQSSRTAKRA